MWTASPLFMCLVVSGAYFVAYCSAPSTSIGAVVATATQRIHPVVKLAKEPCERCGKRTTPPEIGNMVPSSAKTRPISIIKQAAITQDRIADGPASWDAVSAPNSHPEPMIEPTLANSRPMTPMSRRILVSSPPAREGPAAVLRLHRHDGRPLVVPELPKSDICETPDPVGGRT